MHTTTIRTIGAHDGQEVRVRGWLYNKREKGKLAFLIVRDGTGYLQAVAFQPEVGPSVFEACQKVTQESTLFQTDYFDQKAYLSQSGQLYLEPAAMAFGRVYCFGPTFRAEKSKTRRHLTEFWMVEPEVAYAELPDLLDLAEDFIVALVARALDRCRAELKTLERDTARLETVRKPFPRMTYDEAAALLLRPEVQARAREQDAPPFVRGNDFGGFDETLLTEKLERPVMITHYPAAIKAFYMQPDPRTPDCA